MSVVASSVDPVTARWAGALFNVAKRAGALSSVTADMERISREVSSSAVQAFLFGGRHSREERVGKLDGLLASFHELSRNFVQLLFARNREQVLLHVGDAFRARNLEERGAVEGVVESPRALGSTELAKLAGSLGDKLGKEVLLTSRLNPDLVGGVRVFVGTNMIDASVAGRLEGLRRRLEEAPMPIGTA